MQSNEAGVDYQFIYKNHGERSTTQVIDSLGGVEHYFFEGQAGLKRLVKHQRFDGTQIEQQYDTFGRMTARIDAVGRKTYLRRDSHGRLAAIQSPTGPAVAMRYKAEGQVIERRVGNLTTRYAYDRWQRVIEVTHADGLSERSHYPDPTEFPLIAEYPIQVEDAKQGIKQFSWSSTGQLLSRTDCSQRTTSHRYNTDDQLISVELPNGDITRYQRDKQQRVENIRYPDGSGAHYEYDEQGNRTQHIEHNGETQRYYYNQLNQLQRVDRYTADNTVIRSLYRYDPLGRRLVKQIEHYSIQDNQLHETAEAQVEFYGWDGDRLAFTQTEENQWHVIYEPESFTPLLQLQQPTNTPISEQDKVLVEVMGSLQSTLDYLPAHEAYELSRSVREQTIAQLKVNQQWQTPQLPEECYFYHCNHLGLPEALTNQNGEAVWAASYDAWGNAKEEHNPNSLHQPIRLPGQYHDPETNLYYNRHRYCDSKLGNYINQDPIGLSSGEPNLTV